MHSIKTSSSNPFINDSGKPELRESVVAFIDILGFKNHVQTAHKNGNSQKVFTEFYTTFSTWLNKEQDNRDFYRIPGRNDTHLIRMFSDCLVIIFPIRKKGNGNFIQVRTELEAIIRKLMFFQLEMVNKGYFVRGAVSSGDIFMDEDILYGSALIEAYESESKKAKYPRIILAKSIIQMLSKIRKEYKKQRKEEYEKKKHSCSLDTDLKKDPEGTFFLNYLESIRCGDSDDQFVEELENHRNKVQCNLNNLNKSKEDREIYEKYKWVADYHNCFCNESPSYIDYKITINGSD